MAKPFPEEQRIVITGRLASMSRPVVVAKIVQLGGMVRSQVNLRTDVLVIGSDGWPMRSSGRLTRNLERAEALDRKGHAISIISEREFLQRLTKDQRQSYIHRSHTIDQLSRLTGISGLRLRRWVEQGLIRPIQSKSTVHQFDYREVIAAKTFAKLIALGVPRATLLRNLQRLNHWLPNDATVAHHLVRLQRELLIRDGDGQLIDGSGQLHFEFDHFASASHSPYSCIVGTDPDALYDRAYACEQQGRNSEAIEHYCDWLKLFGDDDDVWFNLGNAYRSCGSLENAAAAYRCSLKCNRKHVDAWNNLGLCLADLQQQAEAIDALRTAALLDPFHAEASFNLADLLDESQPHGAST